MLTLTASDFPSPSEILSSEFLGKYVGKHPNWGFNGLGYIVYKRTYARLLEAEGRTEEWWETVERCVRGAQKIGACYTTEEAERLYDHVFNLRCNFAGRMLWQLGTATVDKLGLPSLVNCWFVNLDSPEAFCFIFDHLMLGGGVGFSVKKEHVHELPKVKDNVIIKHLPTKDADFIVPDSREGWVELLRKILHSYFVSGKGFTYSTILVRGSGEKINGFGGTASGPQILIDGLNNIDNVFSRRVGKKLRSIDALDIANILGSIVVAGNVRRSAQLALGDADDKLFLNAKRWDLGGIPNWRAMSNNTVNADDFTYLSNDFWRGYEGDGEAYGLANIDLCRKFGRLIDGPMSKSSLYPQKEDKIDGLNPCQPGWALVLTKQGIRKLSAVKIGDEIWSKEGWTKVLNKWSTGLKNVYKYTTTAGIFYGTENHRIVSDGQKIEAKDAESIDILRGGLLGEADLLPQDIMDGLVIGDGMVHKASNNLVLLCIGKDDSDYFSSEISPLILADRFGVSDHAYEIQTTIKSFELDRTFDRIIPDRFLFGSCQTMRGFLRGLYSANGSVCNNRITLKATSLTVIEQVQAMLSAIGIKSYHTTNKPTLVEFENGGYLCKQSYDLNISIDREKFIKQIGFIQQYKNDKIKIVSPSKSEKIAYDIKSVELVSREEVFDITVDNPSHTYWTQGCDVSNCAEATLQHGEPCDLAEQYLHNLQSQDQFDDCAMLLYKTQKAILRLPSISDWTNEVVRKNMKIGLGVTGICEDISKVKWLDSGYKELRKVDREWSAKRGWSESIKLTVIKPSGTLSLLAGCTPGGHPAYDKYYIRRVRMSSSDALVNTCRGLGCKVEYQVGFDGKEQHDTVVVEFPCKASETAVLAKDMSAIEQLEMMKTLQTYWADQAVSITVYYRKEELPEIKEWLEENYENSVKSVSFLLHSEHGFKQAPYESITEEKYLELVQGMKPLTSIIIEDTGGAMESVECVSGACPVR